MRVVFAGTPDVAVPSLDALLASRHEVAAVVTRPDARRGRGRGLAASPVRVRAEERGIPVLAPGHPSDPAFLEALAALEPACCPVVAYGAILPPAALAVPPEGWLNLHFSLLPRWRGAAPVQRAILAGDAVTGACVFRIEEGLDTGPVVARLETPIREGETSGALLDRLARDGAPLLVSALDAIEDGVAAFAPQPEEGACLATKLSVDDARIAWTRGSREIERLIRAVTPAPGAWCLVRGERLKVGPVDVGDAAGLAPGEVGIGRHEVRVGTGDGCVVLGTVQPQGRAAMAAADWARGLRGASARLD